MVHYYFDKKRGLASGMAVAGTALGMNSLNSSISSQFIRINDLVSHRRTCVVFSNVRNY